MLLYLITAAIIVYAAGVYVNCRFEFPIVFLLDDLDIEDALELGTPWWKFQPRPRRLFLAIALTSWLAPITMYSTIVVSAGLGSSFDD